MRHYVVYRNVLVISENNELTKIFYFKFELVQTLEYNIPVKFITSTKKQIEDIVFYIWLNLCRKTDLDCFRIDIVPHFSRRHHEAYFTDGGKPHLDIYMIFRHNNSIKIFHTEVAVIPVIIRSIIRF